MPSSNDPFKYSTLSDWINSLNTVRRNLSLTQYSDSNAGQGKTAKSSSITNFLSSLNALKSNTYGSYATFTTSNTSAVSSGKTIVALDVEGAKIDATLASLKRICKNEVTNVNNFTSFSLEVTSTGFSRASFSQVLVSDTQFSRDSNFTKFTDFGEDCSNCSNFSKETKGNEQFVGFSQETEFRAHTGFTTCNLGNNRNTDFFKCTDNAQAHFAQEAFYGDKSDNARDSDFSDRGCTDNSNCSVQNNFSECSNFAPNESCPNTCSKTGTTNTLTQQFSGFAVRT